MSCKKVVLFSTRKIKVEGIFRSFERCDPSVSLIEYFKIKEMTGSKVAKPEKENDDINKRFITWSKDSKKLINTFSEEDQSTIRNLFIDTKIVLRYVIDILEKKDSLSKEERELLDNGKQLLEDIEKNEQANSVAVSESLPFEESYEDNIDAVGKTIADRVSLYGFSAHQGEYAVYAVWPLKISCNDDSWEDALSEAVLELCPDCDEIILWLHDNDLTSMQEKTFRVIIYQKEININNKEIKRSLGVFQHPDPEFNGVLFGEQEEKAIFDSVNALFGNITMMQNYDKEDFLSKRYDSLINETKADK